MNKLEKDPKARLEWALNKLREDDALPTPNGKGYAYTTDYRYGRVEFKAYKCLCPDTSVPDTHRTRKITGVLAVHTKTADDGESLEMQDRCTDFPLAVKDRVQHHVELYP